MTQIEAMLVIHFHFVSKACTCLIKSYGVLGLWQPDTDEFIAIISRWKIKLENVGQHTQLL